jgi:polyphosphate kinase 2 (PPK2 family)
MDIAALTKWGDYSEKRDRMLKETHTDFAPWTVIRANDKRRARLEPHPPHAEVTDRL